MFKCSFFICSVINYITPLKKKRVQYHDWQFCRQLGKGPHEPELHTVLPLFGHLCANSCCIIHLCSSSMFTGAYISLFHLVLLCILCWASRWHQRSTLLAWINKSTIETSVTLRSRDKLLAGTDWNPSDFASGKAKYNETQPSLWNTALRIIW